MLPAGTLLAGTKAPTGMLRLWGLLGGAEVGVADGLGGGLL